MYQFRPVTGTNMTTSASGPDTYLCNTTPTRYFALTGHMDLLASICHGTIRVPRLVFDDADDPTGPSDLLSEIGASEQYWAKRSQRTEAAEYWLRLGNLRTRTDIQIVDMEVSELERYAELVSRTVQRRFGLAAQLGRGEAAVIAIAEAREWVAVMDDWEARIVLQELSPSTRSVTTRDFLKAAVFEQVIDTGSADGIYQAMLEAGYRGPPTLWLE